MSEVRNISNGHQDYRWQLLTTVSMLTLFASMSISDNAAAANNDADHPVVWIELGGQLERQIGQGDPYAPPFVTNYASSSAYKPLSVQQIEKPPTMSIGGEGKLSFTPEGSDWVFSASVRYGRANGRKTKEQDGPNQPITQVQRYFTYPTPRHYPTYAVRHCCRTIVAPYSDRQNGVQPDIVHNDSHAIIDFQAGKDVGLGLFGRGDSSLVSLGVRIAQFTAKSSVSLRAIPDVQHINEAPASLLQLYPRLFYNATRYHSFYGTAHSERSFRGVGPSLSWSSSVPLLGNAQAGKFSLDWGANAAVLFGRRKAAGHHHESGHFFGSGLQSYYTAPVVRFDRDRIATVPNVGGFAGVSFKFPNAKVSMGYRGDFFFGAMDTGIDTERTKTVGFYGPFASISIGFGG
jgi:iron complex outermembrane receptor protein